MGNEFFPLIIFMGIAVPEIVLGSSLLSMFVQVRAPLGFTTILLSHIAFGTPFGVQFVATFQLPPAALFHT